MELSQTASSDARTQFEFKSPRRILVRFFKRSRDNWKRKYMEIKKEIKRLHNRAADARKSRDHWKQLAKQRQGRVEELTVRLVGHVPTDDRQSDAKKNAAAGAS